MDVSVSPNHPDLGVEEVRRRVEDGVRRGQPAPVVETGSAERLHLTVGVRAYSSSELRGFYLPLSQAYGIGPVRLVLERPAQISGLGAPIAVQVWQADRQAKSRVAQFGGGDPGPDRRAGRRVPHGLSAGAREMSRSLGASLPEDLRHALSQADLAARLGRGLPLLTVDSDGRPHPMLCTYVEILAISAEALRVVVGAMSGSARNLAERRMATLLIVEPERVVYVKCRASGAPSWRGARAVHAEGQGRAGGRRARLGRRRADHQRHRLYAGAVTRHTGDPGGASAPAAGRRLTAE